MLLVSAQPSVQLGEFDTVTCNAHYWITAHICANIKSGVNVKFLSPSMPCNDFFVVVF